MIFVDTGAWVALTAAGDRHAQTARALHSEIGKGSRGAVVTTDYVLDEAATFIRMDTDVETAVRFLRTVHGSKNVTLIWIGPEHFEEATDLFERHGDKRWSFTDCTSFTVMRELGIREAFTFDRNFREAGFSVAP